jgi:hypothetical protein
MRQRGVFFFSGEEEREEFLTLFYEALTAGLRETHQNPNCSPSLFNNSANPNPSPSPSGEANLLSIQLTNPSPNLNSNSRPNTVPDPNPNPNLIYCEKEHIVNVTSVFILVVKAIGDTIRLLKIPNTNPNPYPSPNSISVQSVDPNPTPINQHAISDVHSFIDPNPNANPYRNPKPDPTSNPINSDPKSNFNTAHHVNANPTTNPSINLNRNPIINSYPNLNTYPPDVTRPKKKMKPLRFIITTDEGDTGSNDRYASVSTARTAVDIEEKQGTKRPRYL